MMEVLHRVTIQYPQESPYYTIIDSIDDDKLVPSLGGGVIPGLQNYYRKPKNDSFTALCSDEIMEQTKTNLSSWGVTFMNEMEMDPLHTKIDEARQRVITQGIRSAPSKTELFCGNNNNNNINNNEQQDRNGMIVEYTLYSLENQIVVEAIVKCDFAVLPVREIQMRATLAFEQKTIEYDEVFGLQEANKKLKMSVRENSGTLLQGFKHLSFIVSKARYDRQPQCSVYLVFSFSLSSNLSSSSSSTKPLFTTTFAQIQDSKFSKTSTIVSSLSTLKSSASPLNICVMGGLGCGKSSFLNSLIMMDTKQSHTEIVANNNLCFHKTTLNNFIVGDYVRDLTVTDASGFDFLSNFNFLETTLKEIKREIKSGPSVVICTTARHLFSKLSKSTDNEWFWSRIWERLYTGKSEFVVPENLKQLIDFYKKVVDDLAKSFHEDTIQAATRVIILVSHIDMIPLQHRNSFQQFLTGQFMFHGIPQNYVAFGARTCEWNYSALDRHDREIQEYLENIPSHLDYYSSLDYDVNSDYLLHDYNTSCNKPNCSHEYTPETKLAYNKFLQMIVSGI